jgi:two-component system cell cycle sensor histidine kinase/response regulator CckA
VWVKEIERAGERASEMTKQLLAFTRKQVLLPRVLDLNAVVSDVSELLSRLIGEDVELILQLAPELKPVEADSGQLEQVIVNLAVNARDAMPVGGRLTITTAQAEIGGGDAEMRVDLEPGAYVTLAVSDSGDGMDSETMHRIFEPFFTTKEEGKGTGLGLATVFGIIKQSGGDIRVQSVPGHGSTFTIYLPSAVAPVLELAAPAAKSPTPRGCETVLVVEDEDAVRHLEREVLESNGYTVIEAAGPSEAIELASSHEGVIHLLLTDLVMPEMNGQELARRLAVERPHMKMIFASGYSDDAFIHRGMIELDGSFLAKPLTPHSIAQTVRDVLDGAALRRAS